MSEAGPETPAAPARSADWRERHGATLRAILVGCGSVFLALLLFASLSLYVLSRDPRDRRLAEGLVVDSLESDVAGDNIPPADRKELDAAYSRFRRDWSDGRIREADGDRARHWFMDAARRDRVTATDIRALARQLDAISRSAPPVGR